MSSLKTLKDADENSECLDLTLKKKLALVYFKFSDPGYEYDIFSGKDIETTSSSVLKEGGPVTIKYGGARTQGTLIAMSDDPNILQSRFELWTKSNRESLIRDMESRMMPKKKYNFYTGFKNEEHIPVTCDKQTQTESNYVDDNYIDLQRRYEEIKREYGKVQALVTTLQTDMENSLRKVTKFNGTNRDTPSPSSSSSYEENKENIDTFNKMVQIGSRGTKIPQNVYDAINWSSHTAATRKLLVNLFPRRVLATHSLTGKPSPAFLGCDKETKAKLNSDITMDIVDLVSKKCNIRQSMVRSAITTKCADENKLYRKRLEKGDEDNDDNYSNKKAKLGH